MPKGYQICECGEVVKGARTKACPVCQAPLGKDKPVVQTEDGEIVGATRTVFSFPDGYNIPDTRITHIHTPAGECPIRLRPADGEDFPSDDAITTWAGDVRQHMIHKGMYLTNAALMYWGRKQVNPGLRYSPVGDEMLYLDMIVGNMPDITYREVPA